MNQNYRLEHLEYNHQNQKPNPYIDKYIFHNQKGIKAEFNLQMQQNSD